MWGEDGKGAAIGPPTAGVKRRGTTLVFPFFFPEASFPRSIPPPAPPPAGGNGGVPPFFFPLSGRGCPSPTPPPPAAPAAARAASSAHTTASARQGPRRARSGSASSLGASVGPAGQRFSSIDDQVS